MIRTIVEDYEAKLLPVGASGTGSGARGKAEWERYGNGEVELKIRIHNVNFPDETLLDVQLRSFIIGRIVLKSRRGVLRIQSRSETVPHAKESDSITIVLNGTVILQGIFVPD